MVSSELNAFLLLSQDIVRGLRNESAKEQIKEEDQKSKTTLRKKKKSKKKNNLKKQKNIKKEEIKNICGRKNR